MADPLSTEKFIPLYPPSWVDRVLDWIDRLPIPYWLFSLLLIPIGILFVNVLYWLTGTASFGTFATSTYGFAYLPMNLLLGGYVKHLAANSMDQFAPALDTSPDEFARLKYSLITFPQREALIITFIIGVPFNAFFLSYAGLPLIYAPFSAIGYALGGCVLVQILRQLRDVVRLHRIARHVSLFDLYPLYAFSRLTVRIGILILVTIYFSAALGTVLIPDKSEYFFAGVIFAPMAIACFVLPLNGMHQRLAKEKTDLLSKINRQLVTTLTELNRVIDAGNLDRVDLLNRTANSLINERDIVHKISTWPWQAGTFRGFATTLLLPIIIWLITRLLTRFGI